MGDNKYIAITGKAKNWEEAIRLCGKALAEKGYTNLEFIDACINREKEYPTGLPSSIPVAIPHEKSEGINESSICFLRLDEPVKFYRMDSSDEFIETNLIFNLAIKNAENHLILLQNLMRNVMDEEILSKCNELSIDEVPGFLEEVLG